ncbi:MAG: CNNM domain-containing protein [Halobacteriaceae archaeon]
MADLTLAWLGAGATVGLLALSAFFSSAEMAIFSLPVEWVRERAAAGDERAAALAALHDDPHRLLVTVLVGNNVVNVAISSVVTVVAVTYASPGVAVTVATLLVSSVVLVFGEIVPKSYGLGHAREWALTVARPVTLVERGLSPLVSVFDAVTRRINARIGADSHIEEPYVE